MNSVVLSYARISLPSLLVFCLYAVFFTDIINLVMYKSAGENGLVSTVSRAILELLLLLILFRNKEYIPIIIMCIFTALNLFGMLIVYSLEGGAIISISEILSNLIIVNKFFFVFLMCYVFYIYRANQRFIKSLYTFFEFAFLIYVATIFSGYIFGIDIFESYIGRDRFGYKGVIVTQNEAVGLFLVGMFYFYTKFKVTGGAINLLFMCMVFFAGFLVGSKACMVFLSLAFIVMGMTLLKKKKVWFFIVLALPFMLLFDWGGFAEKLNSTRDYVLYFYNKGDSILSIILTGRNWRVETLIEELFFRDHYTWYNYFFGGFNFLRLGTEMDFFDVLTLFGLAGLLYYILYIRMLYSFSGRSKDMVWFLVIFLIPSTLGGHLIYNAVIPVFLLIMCLRMRELALNRPAV